MSASAEVIRMAEGRKLPSLEEAKAFAHGTVRSWKRGNVLKQDKAWLKLQRDKQVPTQPIPSVMQAGTTTAYDPSASYVSSTLEAIVARLGAYDVESK